ncbi:MAG: DnaJ C-terminal domain-containing protein [Desulfovibrio sp.]|uniref:DnaJ C-terminal domain-containing protein n=1 Tax=Desulfovibrio sp. 7SRBS1 TaxID=3378064 RepID=UPI003B407183
MSVKYKDYYELLDVDRKASQEEISKAFKKLARKYHPDLNPGDDTAEAKFKEANEAYEVLKDPEKRKKYDALGHNWQAGQDFQPPPGYENMHFNFNSAGGGFGGGAGAGGFSDFFEFIFGGAGAAGGRQGRASGGGFEDMFGRAGFAGGTGFTGGGQSRGQDVEAKLDLTLEEAYRGGTKSLSLSEAGGGAKTLSVNIPKGIKPGQRIRLANQGSPGFGGGSTGDLYLKVNILPHNRFKLEDANIVVDLPLAPWEAATGATVRVPTLDGMVDLKVPAGMCSGQKLRLRGKGLGSGAKQGDLFIRMMVKVPKAETDEVKELWAKLADATGFNPRSF